MAAIFLTLFGEGCLAICEHSPESWLNLIFNFLPFPTFFLSRSSSSAPRHETLVVDGGGAHYTTNNNRFSTIHAFHFHVFKHSVTPFLRVLLYKHLAGWFALHLVTSVVTRQWRLLLHVLPPVGGLAILLWVCDIHVCPWRYKAPHSRVTNQESIIYVSNSSLQMSTGGSLQITTKFQESRKLSFATMLFGQHESSRIVPTLPCFAQVINKLRRNAERYIRVSLWQCFSNYLSLDPSIQILVASKDIGIVETWYAQIQTFGKMRET